MNNGSTTYVIDTNILINYRIFIPMKFHVTFWKQLSASIAAESIILLQDVADECKKEPLKSWVKEQKTTKIIDEVRMRSVAINNKYGLITATNLGILKSKADPVIIAFAEKKQCSVFTHENKKRKHQEPNKIPDVCEFLNVPCEKWTNKVLQNIKFDTI